MAETKTKKPAKTPFKERVSKFFREYKSELKKISWASRAQTMNNTWAVLAASVVIALIVGIVDFLSSAGLQLLGNLI